MYENLLYLNTQRLKILTTPWRDTVQQVTTLNGIQTEPTYVKSDIIGEPV